MKINTDWKFQKGFVESYITGLPNNSKIVDIPHNCQDVPYNCFNETIYQHTYTYEKIIPPIMFGIEDSVILTFEGIMLSFDLYVNGTHLGKHVSGWVPCSFDITKYVSKLKRNRVIVVVHGEEDPTIPPFGKTVDYLTFAGIYRPVSLDIKPNNYLERVNIITKMDGTLILTPKIVGNRAGTMTYEVFDNKNVLVKKFNNDVAQIEDVEVWDLDYPYLYTLKATYTYKNQVSTYTHKIGFRDCQFRLDGFYLNNKHIDLIGLNRHQNYPYVGPAMPDSAQEEDAEIIKYKLGCNIVRTSHYPQSEAFLNKCDEIGLLAINEVPGWQYIGKDEPWRDNFYYFLEKMVDKEFNHPSLIAHGVRIDESFDDDELYSKANELCRKLDPSRQTLGVRCITTSKCLEDIYCFNDFSCDSLKGGLDSPSLWIRARKVPKLVSEHNGHMFPTKSIDRPERRAEHALRHLNVINDSLKYKKISGAIGWCAFDYYTHRDFGSGDHICYHGVSDMYRNEKDAAYAYLSQQDKTPVMHICNPPIPGDNDGSLLHPMVCLTNCDYVEFYRNGEFIGKFTGDRKRYKYLPHPPVIIDDYVGESFNEPGFSKHDAKVMASLFNDIGDKGYKHISLKNILMVAPQLVKHGMSIEKVVDLFTKYMIGWGDVANTYTFKGYKNDELVIEKNVGPSLNFKYSYDVYKTDLRNNKTYDCSRVAIKLTDEFGTPAYYAQRIINFETTGPLKIIGPNQVSLIGGSIATYVRSEYVSTKTKAQLIITTDLGTKIINFTVYPSHEIL